MFEGLVTGESAAPGVASRGAPLRRDLLEVRDVLGAVDVRLFDGHLDPHHRTPPRHRVHRQPGVCLAHLGVLHDPGPAVHMQPDPVPEEVDHENAEVGVLLDIAEAGQDAVPPVFGVGQRARVEHPQKAGRPGAEGAVALPVPVGGGQEEHFLAVDELPHPDVEVVQHLIVVEAVGAVDRAQSPL
ncbi:hypothetical protein SMALA_3854 [Streptomyces malaysiensis subsp. malaysiensis]|nr:hypothetical protein SMALA_3854 [Streptomyces malaysiensis]